MSHGPCSVYDADAPHVEAHLLSSLFLPILGIFYGLQEITHMLDRGEFIAGNKREFVHAQLTLLYEVNKLSMFKGFPNELYVCMSHREKVSNLLKDFSRSRTR